MKTSRLAAPANPCGGAHTRVVTPPLPITRRRARPGGSVLRSCSILALAVAMACHAHAGSVNLAWNPNPESDIAGYRVSYGTSPGVYSQSHGTGNVTRTTISGLTEGATYYFVLQAVNTSGVESDPTAVISIPVPIRSLIPRDDWTVHHVDSEEAPTYAAHRAFDGNPATFWHTAFTSGTTAPPHDLQLDLGTAQVVGGFRYLPRQDTYNIGNIAGYEFYVSLDGIHWGSPVAGGTFENTKAEKEVLFPAVNGRYVMLRQLSEVHGMNDCAVAELNVIRGEAVALPPPPENQAPVASSASFATHADTPVSITLAASDPEGGTLSYEILSLPALGTLTGTAPALTYTPAADASGGDSFTFRASDGELVSNTATIAIDIAAVAAPPPVTAPVTLIERSGWKIHFVDSEEPPVYAAEHAIDGDPATFWHTAWIDGTTPPPHELQIDLGAAQPIAGFRYLPRQDAYDIGNIAAYEFYVSLDGVDWGEPVAGGSFTDSKAEKEVTFATAAGRYVRLRQLSEVNGIEDCAVAELNLIAGDPAAIPPPRNRAPVAMGSAVSTDEDTPLAITLEATDPDGNPLVYQIVSRPASGSLSGTAPVLTYTPDADANGGDSFTFRVSDGALESETVTVTIDVRPVNDAPSAAGRSFTTEEEQPLAILLEAHDPDGDPLEYRIAEHPAYGRLGGTAPNLTYTPNRDFHGADRFTFIAHDGSAGSEPATVTIGVSAVNDPPVVMSRMVSTPSDVPLAITLFAKDADGDALQYRIVSQPMKGRLSGTAPALTYTPHPRVSGSDSISYQVHDGTVDSSIATIFISLTAPTKQNRPPVFNDTRINRSTATADTFYTCAPLEGTAVDPDGDFVAYEKSEGPDWLAVAPDGSISGMPTSDAEGLNTFTIRARDPEGAYSEASLEIEVAATGLPLPWTMERIGAIGEETTASGEADALALTGSGNLTTRQDAGLFVWQTLTGDGDITVRLASLYGATGKSRVGLMIRESLAPDSKHAFIALDAKGYVRWLRRTRTAANTSSSAVALIHPENTWLRISRLGGTIRAHVSADGNSWTHVAAASIDLGSSSYIGLAVASGGDQAATAVFHNVSVTP